MVLIISTAVYASASAEPNAVPLEINYQGRLLDAGGNGIDGVRKFQFNIYTTPTGGTPVWGPQIFDNVAVRGGLYNMVLGGVEGSPISDAFSGAVCYLGIKVTDAGGSFDGCPTFIPGSSF